MAKILFVQESHGESSEVFLYRLSSEINIFDIEVLTGRCVNIDNFPVDKYKLTLWSDSVTILEKFNSFINRKLKLKGPVVSQSKNILSSIEKSNADLVCFQFGFLAAMIGNDIFKIKNHICIIHHGTDINMALENKPYLNRLKVVWKKAKKIIFVSKFLMDVAISLGCPKEKSSVIYLGVPIKNNKIKSTSQCDSKNNFKFVCVGRMVPVKNHINLLRAFSKVVHESHEAPTLILIGDGELRGLIQKEVEHLGIKNNIQLLGSLSNEEVYNIFTLSNCVVLVSKIHIKKGETRQEEGLPISLLEGASCGLPMIGSKTGGIPEIIDEGVNGFLVDPLDVDAIKNAMIYMIENREEACEMGKNAKRSVIEKFDYKKQTMEYEKAFLNIIKE